MKGDGGCAFPTGTDEYYLPGMTLRDYFAAKALPIAFQSVLMAAGHPTPSEIAKRAYELADAMIAAARGQP